MKLLVYGLTGILVLSIVASCSNVEMNKGKQGAIGGAAGGALLGQALGGNTEATLIGAAVGTMLGYIVGNEMDKNDRKRLNQVYESGQSGQTQTWQNPDTGNSYQVTPKPATTSSSGRPCRRAEISAVIDGKKEKTYTTACRNSRGEWELQR